MSESIQLNIDGKSIVASNNQTIMEAADEAGIYIPRLCAMPGLSPFGSCRVCTVLVDGRICSACTTLCMANSVVENDTDELNEHRRNLVEMLFSEGNHFCMSCEKSGMCELQALGYRLGITASRHAYFWPTRELDASHSDIILDHNRCIQCGRCVQASKDLDGKNVFQFINRGLERGIGINAKARLKDTSLDISDKAVDVCPVGAILKKRTGFKMAVGTRPYDKHPIGHKIEEKHVTVEAD